MSSLSKSSLHGSIRSHTEVTTVCEDKARQSVKTLCDCAPTLGDLRGDLKNITRATILFCELKI